MIERLLGNRLALAGAFVLCAVAGAGIFAAIQALVPGMGPRGQAERVVHDWVLAHPEVLLESVERYNQKQSANADKAQAEAVAAAEKTLPAERAKLETPYAGGWAGNPRGDVTVVAFMDYACGYCRASLPAIQELLKRDPNVKVVYREYPVLGPDSLVAARWALAAAEQDKFRAFHDALFAMDGPSAANIEAAAGKAGLDMAKAKQVIGSKPVEGEIVANHKFGQKLAMTGTPSWVVGGKLLYGMRDYDGLAAAVAEARKGK
ncbi:DsbA family protein [Sphingomonas kyeonggiensis]|uniref:Protein-disulfide isomerase n=1 Tax=Sphingomonas kyeonggiensis TaxID=1268553 RepID=A0A7W6JWK8_9SPHN|nr:protein-disulfide isomerase [Sphingomonas kyeonggiensis]